MTRAVIFAIAAVGLNLALGIGGFISFGHAAFFGLGGYVMGILARHSQSYVTLIEWPIIFEGTKSMPLIWIITILLSALLAAIIGMISLKQLAFISYNDNVSVCSNDVLFFDILERLWW